VRALKLQYILTYAVIGSVVPYLAVFFKERGLDEVRIGYVVAAAAVAMMFTPALVALLADTCVDARRLSAGLLALTAAALLAVREVRAFPHILALWTLHSATMWPIYPLQDAICFADQRRRKAAGERVGSFESVRIWGSVGFMVPSAALFWLLKRDDSVRVTFVVGAAFALAAAVNALRLPAPEKRERPPAGEPLARKGSPARAAARVLARRPLLVFCGAMFLLYLGTSAHTTYYPLYLKERVHVPERWLGLVNNFGVVAEVVTIVLYARLLAAAGSKGLLKRLMVLGVACTALRMALLAAAPNAAIAVGTQVFHGVLVLAMLVAPPQFLDRHAEDWYRNSMQGVYAMLVPGVGRIVGTLAAGPIARWSLQGVFACSALLCLAATLLVAFAFYEEDHPAAESLPPALEPA
jgi:PPP family 3-phenylpropionic acid transporter